MTVKNYSPILFLITILLVISCGSETSQTPITKEKPKYFEFSSFENKFKYADLTAFSIDTIQWDKRMYFYAKLDSQTFFQVYQDTSLQAYIGGDIESLDLDFYYSKQKNKRGLLEFTILTQREGEYCDRIIYHIYDLQGKLISSFRVAGSCGDGGYYETASGKFLNDSTYELLSEDNYKTENIDISNIITYSQTLTTIRPNGRIVQVDKTLKIEEK